MMCVLMSATFTSCGDDDEPTASNLVGKWKVTESDGSWDMWEFNSNGTLTRTTYDADHGDKDVMTNNKYTVTGNQLRVDFNIEGGVVDDYTLGTYSISGDKLTYTIKWYDGGGEWVHDETETYVFTKVK